MRRDPIHQFLRDPDNKARLFMGITGAMIITTFLVVIGTIMLILILVGVI
ncbi:MAG: hypothetical protein Q4Q24_06805 [Methanobrevibacter ruminantium]|nr:hypothetical protein [Methanobrevibacter ruminantium]MCI5736958.1 hypothetical protein [Methanobrevibacter ruminantium]MDD6047871.1 hypothetical protein [Methanobrevibacter ruminantium]MDO5842957.1 hypothetical protein [Methanobrevibacter ruminantium]